MEENMSQPQKLMKIYRKPNIPKIIKFFKRNWQLYLLILPVVIYFAVFHYWPMYGVQIAFKDFMPSMGITGSPWVGFKHFDRFFHSYQFIRVLKNTLGISIYQLAVGFPIPIILALMMNEIKSRHFKKAAQTITYIPHFLSIVVLTGMITSFLSPQGGIVNVIIGALGFNPIRFMSDKEWFKSIYVFSGIWQNAGWGTVIYMASLAGIDTELYEAAVVDGASKLKKIIYITIPSIIPVAIIMLILQVGQVMNVGFEKVFLLQNELILDSAEVISTYTYKMGLLQGRYDYAAAVGMFNSVINFTLLVTINKISKKLSGSSLW